MAVVLVRALLRLWLFTLRIRRTGPPFDRPAVIVFWHGDQFPLLAVRPSAPVAAAVSRSRDGSLQAGILGGLGVVSVRGSSSRGGAHAARGLLRALRAGWPVLLAVDGPRGPRGSVAPGAAFLAGRTGFPVQAVGVAVPARPPDPARLGPLPAAVPVHPGRGGGLTAAVRPRWRDAGGTDRTHCGGTEAGHVSCPRRHPETDSEARA
jgi:hypothetical protein